MIPSRNRLGSRQITALLPAAALMLPGLLPAATFDQAQPLLQKYCYECHSNAKVEGSLNLEALSADADFREDADLLEHLEWVIEEEEMPPMKAVQPTEEERATMFDYIHETLLAMQNAQPNDPGLVIMPRINTKEYDYVVEQLTGEELDMGQFLTADGTAGEGFLNVGAGQSMSVGQFEGFLSTAKKLFDHSRAIPGAGLFWTQNPQMPPESKEKLREYFIDSWEGWHDLVKSRLINAQEKQLKRSIGMVFEAYLEAAWQYEHRAALGMPDATIDEIAAGYDVPLFEDSLRRVHALVTRQTDQEFVAEMLENPVFAELVTRWEALPAPSSGDRTAVRDELKALAKWKEAVSGTNDWGGVNAGLLKKPADRPAVQELRGQYHRSEPVMTLDFGKSKTGKAVIAAAPTLASGGNDLVLWQEGVFTMHDGSQKPWHEVLTSLTDQTGAERPFGWHPRGDSLPEGTIGMEAPAYLEFPIPDGAKELSVKMTYDPNHALDTASVRIAALDAPPSDYDKAFADFKVVGDKQPKGARRAWALLDDASTIDTTNSGYTRMRADVAFHGVDPDLLAFYGKNAPDQTSARPTAIFSLTAEDVRRHASTSELKQLDALQTQLHGFAAASAMEPAQKDQYAASTIRDLATRAWRRMPTEQEQQQLVDLYRSEIDHGLTYEAALETALTAILMSPEFLYRFTASKGSADPYPITDRELATRLAFVLWGGLPDEELLQLAASDQLHAPDVMNAQIARMLKDERSEAFVEQFLGHWLHFSDFDKFSGPDAEKFEEFDKELKEAMYAEVVLFFTDLIQNDKPMTTAFTADYTYLNERLAKHYDIDGVKGDDMRPVKLETDQRGGILGMGAFLTNTSKPLRTSPINRGVWLYEHVLGIPIPAPPANVPLLSDEEVNEEGLTIAQQLAEHRSNPACFSCHDRFDPLGVAFENYDPIGRWREEIAQGAPVTSVGEFASGDKVDGINGLRAYVESRQDVFLETMARKLIGYSLGRGVLPTDRPLIAEVVETLKQNNYSLRSALEVVLNSQQFRMRRDELTDEGAPESSETAAVSPAAEAEG